MIRMSRILLLAVLCSLPSLALAQAISAGEEQQPAPGEPGGALSVPSDEIERFDRSVSSCASAELRLGSSSTNAESSASPPALWQVRHNCEPTLAHTSSAKKRSTASGQPGHGVDSSPRALEAIANAASNGNTNRGCMCLDRRGWLLSPAVGVIIFAR